MTKIEKLITAIKKRITSPRIYAVELICDTMAYLHVCATYSLEEALADAKRAIQTDLQKGQIDIAEWKLNKYCVKDLEELIQSATIINSLPNAAPLDKNQLMQKIINEKNSELFIENISIFSENEKKMLNDKLTKNEEKSSRK